MQRTAVLLLCGGLWSASAQADPCDKVGRVVGGFAGGATGYGLVASLGIASNWVTAGLYGAGITVGSMVGSEAGEIGCDHFAANWQAIGETYCEYSTFNYDCTAVQTVAESLYADFAVCPSCSWGEIFGAFLLDDQSRQDWLRRIQNARGGNYLSTVRVLPRDHISGLSGASLNSYFSGVQAGLSLLRSTSMYVIRD